MASSSRIFAPRIFAPQILAMMLGALAVGVAGWAACIGAAIAEPQAFFRAYLFSYVFWMQLPIGALSILAIYQLTGGKWGNIVEPSIRAAILTFPILIVFFVPICVGMRDLYPWTHPGSLVLSEQIGHFKEAYLVSWAYWLRSAVYFAGWLGVGWLLLRNSGEAARRWAAPGLIALALVATFSAIDWVMSIEPDWRSTAYGPIFIASEFLSALALAIVTYAFLPGFEVAESERTKARNDAGNVLLVSLLAWIYLSFMQYLIIWSANLPDEVTWYINRTQAGWKAFPAALAAFGIFLPFFSLLFRCIKTRRSRLGLVAGLLLYFRVIWAYWYVAPAYHPSGFSACWEDFAAFFAIGGIWVAGYLWALYSPRARLITAPASRPAASLKAAAKSA